MQKSDGTRPGHRIDEALRGPPAAPGAGPAAPEPVLRFAAELGRLLGRHLAESGPDADRPHAFPTHASGSRPRSRSRGAGGP
jgi:hypothetical protein